MAAAGRDRVGNIASSITGASTAFGGAEPGTGKDCPQGADTDRGMGTSATYQRRATLAIVAFAVATALGALAPPAHAATSGVRASATAFPRNLRVVRIGSHAASLRWQATPGAARYEVYRDGTLRRSVAAVGVTETGLGIVRFHTWQVRAVFPDGSRSAMSVIAAGTTRHAGGCTLTADPQGSDTATGLPGDPLRTARRLVDRLGAGDVGCLNGSFTEDLTINHGGTDASPLVLKSTPGTRARLRGRFWISNDANNVVVQDLNLDGRNRNGDDLPSPTIEGNNVRLVRNDITNANTAICVILGSIHGFGKAHWVVLDSNRIHHCGRRPAMNHHHGVYLENAFNTRIANNVIYSNADRGIQLYPNSQRALIVRNVIDGSGQGVIFSGNQGYASSGNRLLDNVITNSRLRYNIEYWWPEGNPIGRNNLAARNCLWNGAQGNVADNPIGVTVRDNLIADPRYRARASGDFRPADGSGCRPLLLGIAPLRPF